MLRRRLGGGAVNIVDAQVAVDDEDSSIFFADNWSNSITTIFGPGNFESGDIRSVQFLFKSIVIDQAATITLAYFEPFTIATTTDGAGTNTAIKMEDEDTATKVTSRADFDGRTPTLAQTRWDDQDFSTQFTQSPSIVGVVQEVVDRGGWASGNDMNIFWFDITSGTGFYYKVAGRDKDPAEAAKLHIEWSS